jgi:hypothetical protein
VVWRLVANFKMGLDITCDFCHFDCNFQAVMNWVGGVETPETALNLLGQGGIPVRGLTQGGRIAFIEIEHVWVEAWVDYIPSRGMKDRGGDSWIPMGASFKQYDFSEGVNLSEQMLFDAEALVAQTQ